MINFVLERVELEPNDMLDTSKVFGAPVFPKDFMSKHHLNDDYFFDQIQRQYFQDEHGILHRLEHLYA